jgi:serine/threonine protein kinase
MSEMSSHYFLDMELCSFTLREYVHVKPQWKLTMKKGTVEERVALVGGVMKQVLHGLVFIHEQDEVHRDLHPLNGT